MINRALSVVYILYCIEVGIFLLCYPWMRLWEQNSLLIYYPLLRPILLNNFFRGAVSGLGVINLILAAWEAFSFPKYFRKA